MLTTLNKVNTDLEDARAQLENNNKLEAGNIINDVINSIRDEAKKIENLEPDDLSNQMSDLTDEIKIEQEKYAFALSKYESIKTETIKRQGKN